MAKFTKIFFVTLGLVSLILGAIGAFLPILPTTPFLLLALFSFTRGSEKLNLWFTGTTLYKNYLENFVEQKAMSLKQKVGILLFADAMIAFPLVLMDNPVIKVLLLLLVLVKYYYFIFAIKTIR